MISQQDQKFIISVVESKIQDCLIECDFDPTIKEPGHTYGEKVEEKLVKKLVNQYPEKFSSPKKKKGKGKQTRKMEDLIWNSTRSYINIKLGYEKGNGQPNMVSFTRLLKNYHSCEIDSYYIFIIDVTGKTKESLSTSLYMFNLYDYLDYVNYNYGTGQVMLKEKQFFDDYDSNKYFDNKKADIMLKLKQIDQDAYLSHIQLKAEQHKKRQEIFNEYI
jgi:hypothetical protein